MLKGRCLDCEKYDAKEGFCSYYESYIDRDLANETCEDCDGFKRKGK